MVPMACYRLSLVLEQVVPEFDGDCCLTLNIWNRMVLKFSMAKVSIVQYRY